MGAAAEERERRVLARMTVLRRDPAARAWGAIRAEAEDDVDASRDLLAAAVDPW
jgi:hypothetical protein